MGSITPSPATPRRIVRSSGDTSVTLSKVTGPFQPPAAPPPSPDTPKGKKRKPPFYKVLLWEILRRLYYLVRISLGIALFAPFILLMLWVNYNIDRSGLFQGALAPRRVVDLMLQGYDVTNFEAMDEREVVQLFAQDVEETPQVIGIGSSRILQFNRDLVGVDSFFNMGVTGADVRDNMTSYYKMVSYGKAPEVLLWSVDPWVFYGSEAAFDYRADADLYNEFLTKVLGVPTEYEEPDQLELWQALIDPAYFQGNVDYYLKNRGQETITDAEGNVIEFNPVEGDIENLDSSIKRSDGSVLYEAPFRSQTEEEILARAAEACMSFNSIHMEGFEELSETQKQAFDSFIHYAKSQGTLPVLILSPWHPHLYEYLLTEPEQHKGFFQVETYLREYCAQNNIPLYGSYDPTCIPDLVPYDFFDGLHCKGSGIAKFFPGVPQVLADYQAGTLPDPQAVTPRTGEPAPEAEPLSAA